MPIYEYQCGHCGERVEVLVRSSAVVPLCPRCGEVLQDRLFSAPHVRKGPAGPAREVLAGWQQAGWRNALWGQDNRAFFHDRTKE